MSSALLSVRDLVVEYEVRERSGLFRRRMLRALSGVSFTMRHGETLGVVGESGCGKSSLVRAILRLVPIASGELCFEGENLGALEGERLRQVRRGIQAIFQDPLDSLDPRLSALESVMEPLDVFASGEKGEEKRRTALRALEQVAMEPELAGRLPHELSGGQCQRVGIARAVVLNPKLIVCDEAVSALDVAVQQQTLRLLCDIREKLGVALLFVSHNLAVVRQISQRVMVLYLGQVMELAAADALYESPLHPYTQALLSAVPIPDPAAERSRIRLRGEIPSPLSPPSGCPFRTRCARASEICTVHRPVLGEVAPDHWVACHHPTPVQRAA